MGIAIWIIVIDARPVGRTEVRPILFQTESSDYRGTDQVSAERSRKEMIPSIQKQE